MHDHKRSNEKRPAIFGCIDFFSGSVASMANVLVGYPLDTIKVKMQMYPELYGGPFNCFKHTVRRYGFKKLYSGLVPALVADLSEKSVLFCAYGYTQFLMNKYVFDKTDEQIRKNQQTGLESAICGSLAGLVCTLTLCPTELIKCKMQALRDFSKPDQITTFQVISQVYKADKFLGFYKGFRMTVIREIPGYFCYFGGYTLTCNLLGVNRNQINSKEELFKVAFAGGVGGVSLWVVIYPIDLIKTNVQVQKRDERLRALMTLFLDTYRAQGVLGLYRGLTPTVIRTFPATGVLFCVYELINTRLTNEVKNNKRYEFLLDGYRDSKQNTKSNDS